MKTNDDKSTNISVPGPNQQNPYKAFPQVVAAIVGTIKKIEENVFVTLIQYTIIFA